MQSDRDDNSKAPKNDPGEGVHPIGFLFDTCLPGQGVKVGDVLFIIHKVRGDRVRIAVYAPKEAKIHRTEIGVWKS